MIHSRTTIDQFDVSVTPVNGWHWAYSVY